LIGQTVSHYRIEARLGEGGMGVVYQAVDLTLGRNVALKFLPPGLAVTPEYRTRMFNEARAAASLLHPGICPVYEVGEHDGQAFIAMGHIEGLSLREKLNEEKLSLTQVLAVTRQVGEALAAAHAKGIIHRDIKPDNVMLTDGDRPVLMDFGLAIVSGQTRLTQDGSSLGTLAYMAPEQLQGGEVDERTDIWALAVMLYEMLSGGPLFAGEFQGALTYSILWDDPEPLSTADNDIPEGLDGILAKALDKDPAGRYQQVDDLLTDLAELEQDQEAMPAGRPQRRRSHRRRNLLPRAGMALAAIAVAVIGVLIWNSLDQRPGGGRMESLGVLPLKNLSGDTEQDIWATGITEQISTRLGIIGSLRVISDQTMQRYAERDDPMPVIGREVSAEGLVAGSVVLDGNMIQITVKLFDAEQDNILWSNIYRRPVSDILNVQNEIAGAIARAIQVALTDQESTQLSTSREIDPEAFKATLIGWNQVNKVTKTSLIEAIQQFQRAIDIDPTYAEGYAGLAMAHWYKVLGGWSSFQETYPLIQAAVKRTLEIDGGHSTGNTVQGILLKAYDWDWEAAEQAFDRALAANPNNAETYLWLSPLYTVTGQKEAAVSAARRTVELDPLNGFYHVNLGWVLMYNQQYSEAHDVLQATIRLHPGSATWAHNHLALLASFQGNLDEACEECDEAFSLLGENEDHLVWAVCGGIIAQNGRYDEAKALADSMTAQAERRYVDPFSLAIIHDGLGEIDLAINMLKRAQDEKSPAAFGLNIENWTDALKADPRFDELMKRMNYPTR
jgi:TolB-like protein